MISTTGRTEMRLEEMDQVGEFQKWENGDGRDFETALEGFSAFIRGHIRRFGLDRRGIDPEDVIQDIKLKLWKRFSTEKNPVLRPSYIKRVMDSTLIDLLRKIRVRGEFIRPENEEALRRAGALREEPPPECLLGERIRAAAETLCESRRKVVKLFLLDMTVDEIASSLNWSRGKTRNLLYRGIDDLKKRVHQEGGNHGNG
jgi:RNA polymerase sigma factor (sigma-70 family)